MTINWTDNDKEILRRREVIIHKQNIKEDNLINKELPTDVHVVDYSHEGENCSDAVRAAKMIDIFDSYFDKLKESGGNVISIKSGYGSLNPKLYKGPDKKST